MSKNTNIRLARFLTGSRAYGYATPDSDYDYREIHAAPIWRIASGIYKEKPKEGEGDTVSFELGHFASLCLKGSPNNVELLFLPEENSEIDKSLEPLMKIKHMFLNYTFESALYGYLSNETRALENDMLVLNELKTIPKDHYRLARSPKRLSHCFRLVQTIAELKKDNSTLQVKRNNADFLLGIRQEPHKLFGGETLIEGLAKGLEELKKLMRATKELKSLPKASPDFKEQVARIVYEVRLLLDFDQKLKKAMLNYEMKIKKFQ